jgi:dihydroorotate dehydrogenase electron transfer subunit
MPADYQATVIQNAPCGEGLALMRLRIEPPQALVAFTCAPGQFVMLDLPESGFYFRRPFSVMRVQPQTDGSVELVLFYKIVGYGTLQMATFIAGQSLNVLGPLGKPFPKIDSPESLLMVGGGIGIAPMVAYAEAHPNAEKSFWTAYGVRSQAHLGVQADLEALNTPERLLLCTDDGSVGYHGNVCDLLEANRAKLSAIETVFVCGPTPMMAGIRAQMQRWASERDRAITVYVSLENHMPCGTGACMGCVVAPSNGAFPIRACTEGPVFLADDLLWENSQLASHFGGLRLPENMPVLKPLSEGCMPCH